MGNPVRVQISPRAPRGSSSRREGDPLHFSAGGGPAGTAKLGAGSRGGRLLDDTDQPNRETILGADFILGAAVLATDVWPPGVFAKVENLSRAEEFGASQALDSGVADELGRFGHRGTSWFDQGGRELEGLAPAQAGVIVRRQAAAVQRRRGAMR